MTIDANNRDTVLTNYRKKLTEHREVEARLKEGTHKLWFGKEIFDKITFR